MEAVIKTSDKKIFQQIMDYLKSLGVSVQEKREEKSIAINHGQLLRKLSSGYKLSGFNREDAYDRD